MQMMLQSGEGTDTIFNLGPKIVFRRISVHGIKKQRIQSHSEHKIPETSIQDLFQAKKCSRTDVRYGKLL